jgi:hypothetical protein
VPLTATLGDPNAQLANLELGRNSSASPYVRTPYLSVTLKGQTLTNVLAARVSLGFDLAVSEATVTLATVPTTGSHYDPVTISMGAGNNNVLRFTGILREFDYSLFPRSVTLVCRGNLSRAADVRPSPLDQTAAWRIAGLPGLYLSDATTQTGTSVAGFMGAARAWDQDVALTLLSKVPGLGTFSPTTIGGTSTDLGNLPPDATVWGLDESVLSYIQKLDAVSLGYRLERVDPLLHVHRGLDGHLGHL